MSVTPSRVVLFLIGLFLAAGVVAYGTGAFRPTVTEGVDGVAANTPSAPVKNTENQPEDSTANSAQNAGADENAAVADDKTEPASPSAEGAGEAGAASTSNDAQAPNSQSGTAAQAKPEAVLSPSFDVLRVEGDGSVVVAGQAAPGADVELVSGSTVLGTTKAGPAGDFAIILDKPLKPGDFSLVLRSSLASGVATSVETAIVSVPEERGGQVLAMVEQPGAPSRLLTVPEVPVQAGNPDEAAASSDSSDSVKTAGDKGDRTAAASETTPEESAQQPAAATGETGSDQSVEVAAVQPDAGAAAKNIAAPVVEAVEIDGERIFIAGHAAPGSTLRVYANDLLLGEVKASTNGRFLVEAKQSLAVGNYSIRVDMIGLDGVKVLARAAVPFEREPGESISAMVPESSSTPDAATQGSSSASGNAADGASKSQPAQDAAGAEQGAVTEQAAKLERKDGAVIIRRGDTLWHISRRAYGHGIRYSTIYLANQEQIRDPNLIWPGQVFRMPAKSLDGETADLEQLHDQSVTVPN